MKRLSITKRINTEVAVGLFVVLGFLCFAWLSMRLGDVGLFEKPSYTVSAKFGSVSGLKPDGRVEISGVQVGKVIGIRLEPKSYQAIVQMKIDQGVLLQEDVIASIRTAGIIGDRYVSISPGGMDKVLKDGGVITETESAINLEQLLSKYIFQK
ncbi:outer membrane lipid asymmetry maintenance protein MlaD [Geopsychrobacter electrodiphilus]|uniref:outer membrane lipid asymmetry maintenance protein MlaD n=1 Tax=Geopsychrobacter electrodiphilus TaxID=225196 RepID=UPI0003651BE7|nr:outer membrane lipid asymmetry maintenance protein MlaD [Geopsychrobacter electrodiphilus]